MDLKEEAKTPESFAKWLEAGVIRAPNLYGGKVVHKTEPEAKAVNVATPSPIVKPGSKPWTDERKDWQSKAAGDDWDGQEPE